MDKPIESINAAPAPSTDPNAERSPGVSSEESFETDSTETEEEIPGIEGEEEAEQSEESTIEPPAAEIDKELYQKMLKGNSALSQLVSAANRGDEGALNQLIKATGLNPQILTPPAAREEQAIGPAPIDTINKYAERLGLKTENSDDTDLFIESVSHVASAVAKEIIDREVKPSLNMTVRDTQSRVIDEYSQTLPGFKEQANEIIKHAQDHKLSIPESYQLLTGRQLATKRVPRSIKKTPLRKVLSATSLKPNEIKTKSTVSSSNDAKEFGEVFREVKNLLSSGKK